jgi:hypothetical protein
LKNSLQQAAGNLPGKVFYKFDIRSHSPLQDFGELSRVATGNALADAGSKSITYLKNKISVQGAS